MSRLSAALLFLLAALPASAEWRAFSARSEASANPAVTSRHIDFQESETGEHVIVDLALFSTKSCKLRVIDNVDRESNLREVMERANCLAGVNGGYFDPAFAPLGLRVVDGKVTSKIRRGHLLNGVLASNGSIQILRVAEFSDAMKCNAAVECGPFLIDRAKPVRGLETTRGARRTFAAIGSSERGAVGFCSSVTLAEFGNVLSTPLGDFKIQRALNLDGGSSSGFWFKRKDGTVFSIPEQKSVRDFVGIVPK